MHTAAQIHRAIRRVGIIAGVFVNNIVPSYGMSKIFGFFLLYVITANILKLTGKVREQQDAEPVIDLSRGMGIGTGGIVAGLLDRGGLTRSC